MISPILIILSTLQLAIAGIDRPRGVPAAKASFYKPSETFKCIKSGETLPFEYINDDYCDCEDGSDEPGTSACPMMKYYCENKGHQPEFILSSRVNDGICDCCDGSDEYEGEKIQCQNFCDEIGRKDREEKERDVKLQEEGYKVKLTYIQQGQDIQQEKRDRLVEVEKEKEELLSYKIQLEEKKDSAEAPEKEAKEKHEKAWEEVKAQKKAAKEKEMALIAFDEIDSNDDQHVDLNEIAAHPEFDIDSDGNISNEEAKEYLEELERAGQDEFVDKIWPNIKEIFKSKRVTEEPQEENEDIAPPDGDTEALPEVKEPEVRPPASSHIDNEDDDDEEDEVDEDEDDFDDYQYTSPPPSTSGDDEENMPDYDEETKQFISDADEARNQFNDADRKVRDADTEINNLKSYLDLDVGPQFEYGSLKSQCFEMTDREYTYKLCPFEKASQRPKSGGSETNLGVWGHWDGNDDDKYAAMKYDKGQNCWNGPDRSVQVVLQCGSENTLLTASEPSRCEYRFDFATPARCRDPTQYQQPKDIHDEL